MYRLYFQGWNIFLNFKENVIWFAQAVIVYFPYEKDCTFLWNQIYPQTYNRKLISVDFWPLNSEFIFLRPGHTVITSLLFWHRTHLLHTGHVDILGAPLAQLSLRTSLSTRDVISFIRDTRLYWKCLVCRDSKQYLHSYVSLPVQCLFDLCQIGTQYFPSCTE